MTILERLDQCIRDFWLTGYTLEEILQWTNHQEAKQYIASKYVLLEMELQNTRRFNNHEIRYH